MARAPEIEERWIADAIDGVPTPGEHDHLFGHGEARAAFERAERSGQMHHAWLLSGPRGIGKATFAFDAAARLLGSRERDDPVRRQIARGAHPGLLHLARTYDEKGKRFRTQLPIDEIRRTQAFFGMTAAGGDRRVCIVDPADEMSIGAANALLKVLEEPPRGATFFVISHQPGRLLPTIRSRCRHLPMRPLDEGEVEAAVRALLPDVRDDALDAATRVASGAPRQALLALQGEVLSNFARFEKIASAADEGRLDWQGAHGVAEKLSTRAAGAEFDQFIDLAQRWIAERARAGAADAGATPRSLAAWARLWERTVDNLERVRTFNLDRKQLVLDLFADVFETLAAQSTGPR